MPPMIAIDPAKLTERDNYKLLIGSIIPRPIAFVTTISPEGVLNAAPYSYFTILTANPPMIGVSVQRKNGQYKDTSRNAIAAGAMVVHITDASNVEQANQAAAALPPSESEVVLIGLTPVASETIAVPGIAEARIRMECVLEQAIPLGGTADAPSADLLIGRVVHYHVAESVYDGEGHIDAAQLQPISRLAGNFYGTLGEVFEIERPV